MYWSDCTSCLFSFKWIVYNMYKYCLFAHVYIYYLEFGLYSRFFVVLYIFALLIFFLIKCKIKHGFDFCQIIFFLAIFVSNICYQSIQRERRIFCFKWPLKVTCYLCVCFLFVRPSMIFIKNFQNFAEE